MRNIIPLDIVGGTSFDRYKKMSIEETFNMLVSDETLVPYAGYEKKIDIERSGEAREVYRSTRYDHLIAVIDRNIYAIDDDLGHAKIGELKSSTGTVFISENEKNQIVFVDGSKILYIYDFTDESSTSAFKTVDLDFNAGYIDFQDGYLIAADISSNKWYLSAVNDATVWKDSEGEYTSGALQTKPDLMVAAVRFDRQLYIIGQKATEIWHDVGNTLFPYQRDNSVSIDYGCLSASTIATGFGLIVWLAANEKAGATIVYSTGGSPKTLSTDGINFRLDKLVTPEDSSAFLFEEDGHVFYQITFKSDNLTLTYDFNTQKFFTLTDENWNFHIAKRVAFFDNKHYFVSYRDSGIYELSTDYSWYKYTTDNNDGLEIPRARICKRKALPDSKRFIINNIQIPLEQGQSSELQKVGLSMCKDGGKTFGNVLMKDLNKLGDRLNRLRFLRLGAANDCVFQLQFWGKTRFVVFDGTMEVRQ